MNFHLIFNFDIFVFPNCHSKFPICRLYKLIRSGHFFNGNHFMMEFSNFISLILIFALNLLFFFSGTVLNSLVILSFWKSTQLRKKLCYFMIMMLSCFDLLAIFVNHPLLDIIAMLWLTGKKEVLPYLYIKMFRKVGDIFQGFSLCALLVLSFNQYLATYYPIFHRTSVTKGRLLILLLVLGSTEASLALMSVNDFILSHQLAVLIFMIIFAPSMLFINYKLFMIARRNRKNKGISPKMKKKFSLKNISSCLLASACFVLLAIPIFVYTGTRKRSETTDVNIAGLWGKTLMSMNATFNCLIFYWKNKILRTEGRRLCKA